MPSPGIPAARLGALGAGDEPVAGSYRLLYESGETTIWVRRAGRIVPPPTATR